MRSRRIKGRVLLWTGRLIILGFGVWLLIGALQTAARRPGGSSIEHGAEVLWGPLLLIFGTSFLWPPATTILAVLWSLSGGLYFVVSEGGFRTWGAIFPGSVLAAGVLCYTGWAVQRAASRPDGVLAQHWKAASTVSLAVGRLCLCTGGATHVAVHLLHLPIGGWSERAAGATAILAAPLWLILPLTFVSPAAGAILALMWGGASYWLVPLIAVQYGGDRLWQTFGGPLTAPSYAAFAGGALVLLGGVLCLVSDARRRK